MKQRNHFVQLIILFVFCDLVNSEFVNEILKNKQSGVIGCMLLISPNITECKNRFENRITVKVKEGFTNKSEQLKKDRCCGYWQMLDCVSDAAKKICDDKSAKSIHIMQSEQQIGMNKKCDGFEYRSKKCGTQTVQISVLLLIVTSFLSLINYIQTINHKMATTRTRQNQEKIK